MKHGRILDNVMTVENIMVVYVGHNVSNAFKSLMDEKCMSQTSLAFNEKDFKWGKHIMFHVGVVNAEDVTEETLDIG